MGNMTLPEFYQHVADVNDEMRHKGVVTVFFMHETLTPSNVRFTWEDHPIADVPEPGDIIETPFGGYWGTPGRWIATKVLPSQHGPSVTVHCANFAKQLAAPWLGWQEHPQQNAWTRVKDDGSSGLTLIKDTKPRSPFYWIARLATEIGGEPTHLTYRIRKKVRLSEAQRQAMEFEAGAMRALT